MRGKAAEGGFYNGYCAGSLSVSPPALAAGTDGRAQRRGLFPAKWQFALRGAQAQAIEQVIHPGFRELQGFAGQFVFSIEDIQGAALAKLLSQTGCLQAGVAGLDGLLQRG